MPFIDSLQRTRIDIDGYKEAKVVGDLCYIIYKEIMKQWNKEPRWTTIHRLKKEFVLDSMINPFINDLSLEVYEKFEEDDVIVASALAFDVFFHIHGMQYEFTKRDLNGDING